MFHLYNSDVDVSSKTRKVISGLFSVNYFADTDFIDQTGQKWVGSGPNVVVKGPPYLPSVAGSEICNDVVNDKCSATGI